jgi:hypothetical protein
MMGRICASAHHFRAPTVHAKYLPKDQARPNPEIPTVFPSAVLDPQNKIIPELLHVRQPSPIMLGLVPLLTLTARRLHLMPSSIMFLRRSHSALPHRIAHDNREIDQ